MEKVNQEKLWQKVALDMGYSQQNKNLGNVLKAHYERILYPLDVFEREEQKKAEALKLEMVSLGTPVSSFKAQHVSVCLPKAILSNKQFER